MRRNVTVALSGKGGVGKTTVAALLVRVLKEKGNGAVLAVDADPNSCLADYLGLEVETNIGSVREEVINSLAEIPPGMTKERWITFRVQECVVESEGMDLIELGRPEGPGCYCYINNLLREYEASVHRNYRYVVIDNEAGMEHLSRRSTQPLDYLLIVSDLSIPGLKAAGRISTLSRELNIVTQRTGLVLNRADEPGPENIPRLLEKTGLEVFGRLPFDRALEEFGFSDGSLMNIPPDSPALEAVRGLANTLGL